jgi:hypothetical protein
VLTKLGPGRRTSVCYLGRTEDVRNLVSAGGLCCVPPCLTRDSPTTHSLTGVELLENRQVRSLSRLKAQALNYLVSSG